MKTLLQLETILDQVSGDELDAQLTIAYVQAAALIELTRCLVGIETTLELIEPRITGG